MSEIFGPTVQGEGPAVGRRAGFLRLARCHVQCSWCDTRYSWDRRAPGPRPYRAALTQVADELATLLGSGDLLVVTGGEPLLQQRSLMRLLADERLSGHPVHLETSGAIAPDAGLLAAVDACVVSPKLAHSGVPESLRLNRDALAAFAAMSDAWFKFVATGVEDLDEVSQLVDAYGMRNVMIMAAGTTADAVLDTSRAIAADVIARGWSLTPRWHILLWGDSPGR